MTGGPALAMAEMYAGYAKACAGGCGRKVLAPAAFHELSKRAQRILFDFNIRVAHEFDACKLCVVKVRKQNEPKGPSAEEIAAERRAQVTALWERVRGEGGTRKDLAEALGVSRQAVDYLLRKYDLPKVHSLKEQAAMFLEELEHLAGLGQGVGYISKALQMEPDALVRKVNHLHQIGKTPVSFHGWTRHADNPQKEAA